MKSKAGIAFPVFLLFWLMPYVSEAKVSVRGSLTHEITTKVGETYQGTILLSNAGEEPQEVKVYQTDYLFFFDGRNIYGEPGDGPRSNANWISFRSHRLVIPSKGTSEVYYTVKVPDDETLVGTYWSMLMIEGISNDSPEATGEEQGEVRLAIRQVVRYGIQMVTHIGNMGARQLEFLNTKLLREEEERILQIGIENSGERWLRPFLWAELYDEKGGYIGRFEGGRLRIYPGTSARCVIDLSQVDEGKYHVLVVADCGGDDLFGATYTLKFEK